MGQIPLASLQMGLLDALSKKIKVLKKKQKQTSDLRALKRKNKKKERESNRKARKELNATYKSEIARQKKADARTKKVKKSLGLK